MSLCLMPKLMASCADNSEEDNCSAAANLKMIRVPMEEIHKAYSKSFYQATVLRKPNEIREDMQELLTLRRKIQCRG